MWEIVKYFFQLSKEYVVTTTRIALHPISFGEDCYLKSYDKNFLNESIGYLFQSLVVSYFIFGFLLQFFIPGQEVPVKLYYIAAFLIFYLGSAISLTVGFFWLRVSRDVKHVMAVWLSILGFLTVFDTLLRVFRIVLDSVTYRTDGFGNSSSDIVHGAEDIAIFLTFPVIIVGVVYRYLIAKTAFQTSYLRIICAEIAGSFISLTALWVLAIPVILLVKTFRS